MMKIPKQLQRDEFRFVKLLKGKKKPFELNWTKENNYSWKEIEKWDQNYGVVCGYGNLLVIDYDNKGFENKYSSLLPKTFCVRTGSGGTHAYYICDDPTSLKILDNDGNTLADIQGRNPLDEDSRKQVVGAGSIHPNGKSYDVIWDVPLATISMKHIKIIFSDYLKPKQKWREVYDNNDVVQELKNAISIKELLGDYGYDTSRNPTMCRLGHDSSGQSCFSFNELENLWYCFHCGEGGDIFNLVMLQEGCDFVRSLDILKKKAGIEEKTAPEPLETTTTQRRKFSARTLESMYEEGIPDIEWHIWRILPKRGVTFFGGTSGSYKTWAAMHLALAVSQGKDFLFKFPSYKAKVLYLDEENGDISLFHRFQMLAEGYNLERPFDNLHVSTFSGMKLDLRQHIDFLDNYIEENDIKVVVADSMVRCMNGQEDKSTDVRLIFDNIKLLLEKRKELSFVLLHHTRKGGQGMDALRGSGDFAAFADIIFMFNPIHKRKMVEVEVVKHRHVDLGEFSNINFEINNPGEGITLATTDKEVGKMAGIIQECCERIEDYIQENKLVELKSGVTSHLFKEMEKLEFSKNQCYEALYKLARDGVLRKAKKGIWEVLIATNCEVDGVTNVQ